MDPFENQIDDLTSYADLDEEFYSARLDRGGIDRGDWPSQIDRAAMDVAYGVALGTTDSAFDHGATIGRHDFGTACGEHYVDGLQALAGPRSDLPRLIDNYNPAELGDLAFRLNELRVELEKLGLDATQIGSLNRATEALIEKLITHKGTSELARQPLQQPEGVSDLLYQLFSDPAVTTYADVLIEEISSGPSTSIAGESLLEHLDRPQMVTPLWEHQQKALKRWVAVETAGYVNMATATGKTVLGLAAIAHLFGELHPTDAVEVPSMNCSTAGSARVLIVAGQDLLLDQWQSEFDEHLNIPHSRTASSHDSNQRLIQLSWGQIEFRTAQELLANEGEFNYELVILDEAHRYSSGRRGGRGWRDLFEALTDGADSVLAMSGSIDDEWLGDSSVKDALEGHLNQCIEFTIEEARARNVIAEFRWDVCYAASTTGETVDDVADSTTTLADVYDAQQHKFEPHDLDGSIPDTVPVQFETLRDLRSFAHTEAGKQARGTSEAFDTFATAAFSRRPKRWQLSPPAETLSQLLADHLPDRKAVVLVQSYAQAESIGAHLRGEFDDNLITIPAQDEEAPYEAIEQYKQASQGVLVGPGEVLGVGVDLPDADVAFNLAKGGVNASLIQRIGRILRNPTGDKQAHFYQIVTVPAASDARLPGEDGRRLLRRASEFRALGSRFREQPGFVVADSDAGEILRELETAGTQAKLKDERATDEMVSDDIAVRLLDEITTEIDRTADEPHEPPALTIHWQPKSLAPGTMPIQGSVVQTETTPKEPTSADESSVPAEKTPVTLSVTVTDTEGEPIENAVVALENTNPIDETTTDSDGRATVELTSDLQDAQIVVSRAGYKNCTREIRSVPITIALQPSAHSTVDGVADKTEAVSGDTVSDNPDSTVTEKEVLAEINRIHGELDTYPGRREFEEHSEFERSDVKQHFDRWGDAIMAARYGPTSDTDSFDSETGKSATTDTDDAVTDVDENPVIKKKEVLTEINRIHGELDTYPGRQEFEEHSEFERSDVKQHFDRWGDAIMTARYGPTSDSDSFDGETGTSAATGADDADEDPIIRTSPETASPRDKESSTSSATKEQAAAYTRAEVLAEIQCVSETLGVTPTTEEFHGKATIDAVDTYAHFDSWQEAVEAAENQSMSDEKAGSARANLPTEDNITETDTDEPSIPQDDNSSTPEDGDILDKIMDGFLDVVEESE